MPLNLLFMSRADAHEPRGMGPGATPQHAGS